MVVLLAIAGSVAAVLFNRASTETARLEGSEATYAYAIADRLQCTGLGHLWQDGEPPPGVDRNNVLAALGETTYDANWYKADDGNAATDTRGYTGYCKPEA